jgi:hypothetical protein
VVPGRAVAILPCVVVPSAAGPVKICSWWPFRLFLENNLVKSSAEPANIWPDFLQARPRFHASCDRNRMCQPLRPRNPRRTSSRSTANFQRRQWRPSVILKRDSNSTTTSGKTLQVCCANTQEPRLDAEWVCRATTYVHGNHDCRRQVQERGHSGSRHACHSRAHRRRQKLRKDPLHRPKYMVCLIESL